MKKKNLNQLSVKQLTSNLVIPVGEARKILGKDAKNMSDDEIRLRVLDLTDLAQILLKHMQSNKKTI